MKTQFAFLFLLLVLFQVDLSAWPGEHSLSDEKRQSGPLRVALLGPGNPDAETAAWQQYAQGQGWKVSLLTWDELAGGKVKPTQFDLIWCHQTDTTLAPAAARAGALLRAYVSGGGKLILDMEAVRLLHTWGIEPNAFQTRTDTIRDEGFGRPLGFHAFKSHPLFEGLHGGAYPWKSKEDHVVRKIGFFEDQLPGYPAAKVAGIEWTYITFHDKSKLLFEYPLGKGNILAVGAFTYFAPENDNRHELEQFYRNAVHFLCGRLNGPAKYWTYTRPEVRAVPLSHPAIALEANRAWSLPQLSISIQGTGDDSFFDLAGRRILVMGKEKGGIDEVWTHPFMAIRDVQAGLLLDDSLVWLKDLKPKVTISPEVLIREYSIRGKVWKEILTISFDQPIAVVHYEFPDEPDFRGLVLQSTFNARFMWPYDAGASQSLLYHYDDPSRALMVSAQQGDLVSLLAFSHAPVLKELGRYDGFTRQVRAGFTGNPTQKLQLGACFVFDRAGMGSYFNLAIAGSSEGMKALNESYQAAVPHLDSLYAGTNRYYRDLLDQRLAFDTPDSLFNAGYRWALARTDQMFQTTPGLGTTHMAGFGTTARGWNGRHEVSGRPGYAWYFGRDAQWSGMAVNAYGDFAWVKEMLKVFEKYQNLNGKIYHELTTSGAVHYDASDATPLFVVLAGHYLKYSGDLDFIRQLWPSLKKAVDFCYSTDTDKDGLIENTNVGHGWIEGGALFGTHTEFYLAGSWAACLQAAAYLAGHLGKTDLEKRYRTDAGKVMAVIDRDFWDPGQQYFYNGKMRDGSYMKEPTVLQAVPIYLGTVSDAQKAGHVSSTFAGRAMTTDWGIRMLAETNPKFNPRSYHAGMVWPLYGGWAALAEYATGQYNSGFFHFYANLLNFLYWGKGSVEETLHGSEFRPAGVCSHQCWSETMVLLPIIEGMLGLQTDALAGNMTLAPRFPWNWDRVSVRNVRAGSATVNLSWTKTPGKTTLVLTRTDTGKTPLTLTLRPAFPPGTTFQQATISGKSIGFKPHAGPESVDLQLDDIILSPGASIELDITHSGGIGLLPLTILPEVNAASKGARIISQQLEGDYWSATFEGLPGARYTAQIWSEKPVAFFDNAELVERNGSLYTIRFQCPEGGKTASLVRVGVK